jgi:hypothetical protein
VIVRDGVCGCQREWGGGKEGVLIGEFSSGVEFVGSHITGVVLVGGVGRPVVGREVLLKGREMAARIAGLHRS